VHFSERIKIYHHTKIFKTREFIVNFNMKKNCQYLNLNGKKLPKINKRMYQSMFIFMHDWIFTVCRAIKCSTWSQKIEIMVNYWPVKKSLSPQILTFFSLCFRLLISHAYSEKKILKRTQTTEMKCSLWSEINLRISLFFGKMNCLL